MDIKKALDDLAKRFDELAEERKEHENIIANISEEQLRMQGEYRALNSLLEHDSEDENESKELEPKPNT